ncbi:MAG: hypothetical protein HRU19_05810 [Pseudobacteriovorax sp.]|nr:hypothetical protein [Pseudobacteriovorax sp.]
MRTYCTLILMLALTACGSKDKKKTPVLPNADETTQQSGETANQGGETEGEPTVGTQGNPDDTENPDQKDQTVQNGNDDSGQNEKDDSGQNEKDDSGQNDDDSGQNDDHYQPEPHRPTPVPFACDEKLIDFDGYNSEARRTYKSGDLITDNFRRVDFSVVAKYLSFNRAILFDTRDSEGSPHNSSTPYDLYLGSQQLNGHKSFERALVIANNHVTNASGRFVNPGFSRFGGSITISFDRDVIFREISLLDFDENGSSIEVFGTDRSTRIHHRTIQAGYDRGYQVETFDKDNVTRKVTIHLAGSGGIDNIRYCERD